MLRGAAGGSELSPVMPRRNPQAHASGAKGRRMGRLAADDVDEYCTGTCSIYSKCNLVTLQDTYVVAVDPYGSTAKRVGLT